MSRPTLKAKYPNSDFLQNGRFSFIDNSVLRANVAMAVQYISFLQSLIIEYDLGGPIQNSAYKNIIILSASVAEGLINWKLHKMIASDPSLKDKCTGIKFKLHEIVKICEDINGAEVFAAMKKPESFPLSNKSEFQSLIRFAEKVGLFNDDLKKKADDLRELRNKVHLASLDSIDDKYTQKDIDDCFSYMTDIVEKVKVT